MKTILAALAFLISVAPPGWAQESTPRYSGQGYVYFAPGLSVASPSSIEINQVGFGGEGFLYKGFGVVRSHEVCRAAVLPPGSRGWPDP